jgi:2-desacetyl-2-hydroxyethyl bacteriochlorophyllide A dehydrogenase
MKAVVFEAPGQVYLLDREQPRPALPSDVLIRVAACGLCGTDQRTISDPPLMSCDPGRTIGHEISGVVVEAGPETRFQPGEPVVVVPNYPCRRCESCHLGYINLCDDFQHLGSMLDGGLAEYVVVPAEFLQRIPAGLDVTLAALAEPLACVLNGADRAQWTPGSPVVILGAGPIGLLFLTVARLAGASPIIVSEPNALRAEKARALGADWVVSPRDPSHEEEILRHTGGARVVVDTLGTLLGTAVAVAAKRGQILIFGIDETATVAVHPAHIVAKELTIEGVYIARGTMPSALKLLAQHPDKFSQIVTDRIPLTDWETAKKSLLSNAAAGKVLVIP